MSVWRHITRGLRVLTHRSDADREVADELQHYVDLTTAAHVAPPSSDRCTTWPNQPDDCEA